MEELPYSHHSLWQQFWWFASCSGYHPSEKAQHWQKQHRPVCLPCHFYQGSRYSLHRTDAMQMQHWTEIWCKINCWLMVIFHALWLWLPHSERFSHTDDGQAWWILWTNHRSDALTFCGRGLTSRLCWFQEFQPALFSWDNNNAYHIPLLTSRHQLPHADPEAQNNLNLVTMETHYSM